MATIKTDLIADAAKLGKFIDGIKARGAKLDKDVHQAAVSAVAHFDKCGDVGYINRLYLALGRGARHVAYVSWVTQFGGVSANEGEGKDTTPFVKDKNKKVDLEGGDALPWYECKPSPKPDEVLDYFALLMKTVTKKAKEGQEVKHAKVLAMVTRVLNEYKEAIDAGAEPGDTSDDTEEEKTED